MITQALILAAGYSSRAEAFKMELPLNGKPILQHTIDAFLPVCESIIVVGGFQIEKIYALTKEYSHKVNVVFNNDFPSGMFSSIQRGVKEVTGDQFFLTPGDFPFLSTNILQVLLEHSGKIVKPVYEKKGGHPLLLPSTTIHEILAEPKESNMKMYLSKKDIIQIEVRDKGTLFDVDTKEDYNIAKQFIFKGGVS